MEKNRSRQSRDRVPLKICFLNRSTERHCKKPGKRLLIWDVLINNKNICTVHYSTVQYCEYWMMRKEKNNTFKFNLIFVLCIIYFIHGNIINIRNIKYEEWEGRAKILPPVILNKIYFLLSQHLSPLCQKYIEVL
jgi:uncharacterized protein with PQ loop repeat